MVFIPLPVLDVGEVAMQLGEIEADGAAANPEASTAAAAAAVTPPLIVDTYWWRLCNNSGVPVQDSMTKFYSEGNCRDEMGLMMQSHSEKGEYGQMEGEIQSGKSLAPSPKELCSKVYRFLLESELQERIKRFCTGCINKCDSQRDHMEGCLIPVASMAKTHGNAAHLRITTGRLTESCDLVSNSFNQGGYVSRLLATQTLEESNPIDILQSDPLMYEWEYGVLKHF